MIRRSLFTRLKRMEERFRPAAEPSIHVIHFVDADGTVVDKLVIQHGGQPQTGADRGR